jgi:hypothetical protein
LFQAVAVRNAGFAIIPTNSLAPAVKYVLFFCHHVIDVNLMTGCYTW